AIRALMKYSDEIYNKYDLSSLRIIASVGEPIGPSAWKWFYENIGKSRCPLIDTYWQTECGSIIMAPVPGINPYKPGSCSRPFLGIESKVIKEEEEEKEISSSMNEGIRKKR